MKTFLFATISLIGIPSFLCAQINPMSVAAVEQDNSVEAELRSFTLAKGYKVDLFASEELGIANPCAMRFDELGRLWVLTIPSYPHPEPGVKPNDKLLILEDSDGDGKADKSTVFADSLHMALGFELGYGNVYLGQQTELLKLTDQDGDGKSDKREVLLSGFGTHDSHQTINSFLWSPGGELFFSQGHSIYSRVETAWGVKKADRAAIWRYRPLTRQTDVFLDGSTASVNPWGMNFGTWGEMFHKANDPELFYTAPGLVNTTHRQLLPPIGKLVIKGSIIEIVRTKHLPDDLQGDFIIAGYYNNKIERMRVKEAGAGYTADLLEPLLSSSSRSFRPIDIKIGPDGAIYVLDWYNPIIGHYQASMRHPDRDKTHGRIWRITAENRPLTKKPDLTSGNIADLLHCLKSEEHWVLYQTRRLLAGMDQASVLHSLDAWVSALETDSADYEKTLMEALNVYASHEQVKPALLLTLTEARSSGARAYAARLLGRWGSRIDNVLFYLDKLARDPHPQVRLEALVALSYVKDARAMEIAASVLDNPMDKFLQHALEKTTFALEPYWSEALERQDLKFRSPSHLAWLAGYRSPSWWNAADYRALLALPALSDEVAGNLLVNVARTGKGDDLVFVLAHDLSKRDAGLLEKLASVPREALDRNAVESLGILLSSARVEDVQLAAVRLSRAWKVNALDRELNALLTDTKTNEKVRSESLLALVDLQSKSALSSVTALGKHPGTSRALRLAAMKALLQLDLGEAASAAIREIQRSDTRPDELKEVVLPMLMQKGGIEVLTAALQTTSLTKSSAIKIREIIGAAGIYAPALSELLHKKSGSKVRVSRSYSPGYVEGLTREVLEKGNVANGRKVYQANTTCVACHAIESKGGSIGPDLSAVGKGLSVQEIITEVLWPKQNIKEGYNQVIAETHAGELIQGIKIFEAPEIVHLKAAATGKTVSLNKKNLKSLTEVGSLMPEGLLDHYSESDVRDLIRFLSELDK